MAEADWGALASMTQAGMKPEDIRALAGTNASVEEILQRYPQLAGFIDHPELGPLLREAAAAGWGPEELQGRLFKTEWYQKTWADFRRWEVLKSTDPAEHQAQFEQGQWEVKGLLQTLGVDLTKNPALLPLLTEDYLRHGKDDWFLFSQVSKILLKDPTLITKNGDLAVKKQDIREWARDLGLDYSDQAITKLAVNIWGRNDTDDAAKERMRQTAIKDYAHLAEGLKRGLTVREMISPTFNAVARTLELNPEEMDLFDPKWKVLWNHQDQDGKTRMMTAGEAERYARMQDDFQFTKTARDEGTELASEILKTFGAIA